MKNTLVLVTVCLVASICFNCCQTTDGGKGEISPRTSNTNDSMVVVNQGGFAFSLLLPRDLLSAQPAVINFNESTGLLEISSGAGFHFTISRDHVDLMTFKKELSEELFYKNEIVSEESNSLLYQRILPDGSSHYYQYITNLDINHQLLHARTISEGQFTLDQVERMKKAIQSITFP